MSLKLLAPVVPAMVAARMEPGRDLFVLVSAHAVVAAILQVTAADAAKVFALEWRMEATAHIASLMVRDQQCKVGLRTSRSYQHLQDCLDTPERVCKAQAVQRRLLFLQQRSVLPA